MTCSRIRSAFVAIRSNMLLSVPLMVIADIHRAHNGIFLMMHVQEWFNLIMKLEMLFGIKCIDFFKIVINGNDAKLI